MDGQEFSSDCNMADHCFISSEMSRNLWGCRGFFVAGLDVRFIGAGVTKRLVFQRTSDRQRGEFRRLTSLVLGFHPRKNHVWAPGPRRAGRCCVHLDGHDRRTVRWKKELWSAEGPDLFDGRVGSDFAKKQPFGSDVDDGEFGDDMIDNFDAG